MGIFNLENIKKSSIYVTPNLPDIQTRRYKFSLAQVSLIILGYSFIVMLVVVTLLALTPAKELIFILENEELIKQADRIKTLEKKVLFLTSQLEDMASTNQKLKYAMILGGVTFPDSTEAQEDSAAVEQSENLPAGGNVLAAFKKLFEVEDQNNEKKTAGYFLRPSDGFIANDFDPAKGHLGVDYAVKSGTPVYAASGGLVLFADYTNNDGYMYIIQHDDGLITIYKHCSSLLKKVRDYVVQGEVIALSGNSGYNTTGAHLHFEIWKNGIVIDPQKFLIN